MKARFLTILCIAYAAFVLYGSLTPFDFAFDEQAAEQHFQAAFAMWPFGPHHASRADMAANVALYVPLGVFLAMRLALGGRRRILGAAAGLGASLALSAMVESLQSLSATRVTQVTDVLANALGGLLGGLAGATVGPRAYDALLAAAGRRIARRPAALAAWALLAVLAAAAIFPLLPTQDVGDIVRSFRHTRFALATALADRPWHQWLAHAASFAALAVLWAAARLDSSRWRYVATWGLVAAFALACELARPFFHTGPPSAARLVVAACGAAAGCAAAAAMAGRWSLPAARATAAAFLAAYLAYAAWQPFDFAFDAAAAKADLPAGIDWLPFHRYALSGRTAELRGFWRAAILTCGMTFAIFWHPGPTTRGRRILLPACLAGGLGLILAAGQLFIASRSPSTADLLCTVLGGAAGGWLAAAGPYPATALLTRGILPRRQESETAEVADLPAGCANKQAGIAERRG